MQFEEMCAAAKLYRETIADSPEQAFEHRNLVIEYLKTALRRQRELCAARAPENARQRVLDAELAPLE